MGIEVSHPRLSQIRTARWSAIGLRVWRQSRPPAAPRTPRAPPPSPRRRPRRSLLKNNHDFRTERFFFSFLHHVHGDFIVLMFVGEGVIQLFLRWFEMWLARVGRVYVSTYLRRTYTPIGSCSLFAAQLRRSRKREWLIRRIMNVLHCQMKLIESFWRSTFFCK